MHGIHSSSVPIQSVVSLPLDKEMGVSFNAEKIVFQREILLFQTVIMEEQTLMAQRTQTKC